MPPADKFSRSPDERDDPAGEFDIVAGSVGDLPKLAKAIRAGADGTITFRGRDMAVARVHPVLAGERIDVVVAEITASNPSNMSIVVYY